MSKLTILKAYTVIALCAFTPMIFSDNYASDAKRVFIEHRKLNNQFLATVGANDLADHKLKRSKLNAHSEAVYTDMLKSLEKQFCLNPRRDVLDEFIATLINTTNSVHEYPSLVFARLFACEPELILNKVNLLTPVDKKTVLLNLKWGFKNITYKNKRTFSNYKVLLDKLNTAINNK